MFEKDFLMWVCEYINMGFWIYIDTVKKNEELKQEIEVLNGNISKEAERKEKVLARMDDLRDSALGKKRLSALGGGIGKGIGMIGGKSITEIKENDDNKPIKPVIRNTSVDPEKGHMNVSWIRHNAPRETLIDYIGPEKKVLTEEWYLYI